MQPNQAYRFVTIMLMLAEANLFCSKTGLQQSAPFNQSDLREGSHVSPVSQKGIGGSILTDQYFFGFGRGYLANYYRRGFMPQKPESAIRERNLGLSRLKSLISTNDAYKLATNLLAQLDLDVATLDRKYRRAITQWKFYPEGKSGKEIELPVYQVEWSGFILRSQPNQERPVVSVTIFGATKELVEYHVFENSLFGRSPLQVKNVEKLLSITDEDFRALAPPARSNLLSESVNR